MVSFKLCISDPSSGRTFQREVKDNLARPFIGLNIGETIKGDNFEIAGYEFQITGGSDYCGFPMRKDVVGTVRRRIFATKGTGIKGLDHGERIRKSVAGNTIFDNTSQVNLKVLKHGKEPLAPKEEAAAEGEKKQETAA